EPPAGVGFRYRRQLLDRDALPRQRATRLLGLERCAEARLAEYRRHQQPRSGRTDRPCRFRPRSRGACCGDQGARPRIAVESLRRPAMDLSEAPHCTLGSIWAAAGAAEIWHIRIPDDLVAGLATCGQIGRLRRLKKLPSAIVSWQEGGCTLRNGGRSLRIDLPHHNLGLLARKRPDFEL